MAQQADTSETAQANRALSHIRKPRITSLDDDTTNAAVVCRKHFADVRDALLRQYPWNFAMEFASLNALASPVPAHTWTRFFDLPQDCVRVLEVVGCSEREWEVMGRRIATNQSAPLKIRYTKRVVVVPDWDALFRVAFAMHLAVAIAPELASDENITNRIADKAQTLLLQAFPPDAAESGEQKIEDTDWVTGR